MTAFDIDGNGFDDIICTGNNYNTRVPHGRDDAIPSFVLMNSGGSFEYKSGAQLGIYNQGDGKSLITLPSKSGVRMVIANNNGPSKGFELQVSGKTASVEFVKAPVLASYAKVTVNGSVKVINLNRGQGYLSSQAPGVYKTKGISKIEFYNASGKRI
jgi:hypothetical protein